MTDTVCITTWSVLVCRVKPFQFNSFCWKQIVAWRTALLVTITGRYWLDKGGCEAWNTSAISYNYFTVDMKQLYQRALWSSNNSEWSDKWVEAVFRISRPSLELPSLAHCFPLNRRPSSPRPRILHAPATDPAIIGPVVSGTEYRLNIQAICISILK